MMSYDYKYIHVLLHQQWCEYKSVQYYTLFHTFYLRQFYPWCKLPSTDLTSLNLRPGVEKVHYFFNCYMTCVLH